VDNYDEHISENVHPESHMESQPIDLDLVFETRRKIMDRGCQFPRHIQNLLTNPKTTFEKLLEFHTFIHDTNIPIDKEMVIIS